MDFTLNGPDAIETPLRPRQFAPLTVTLSQRHAQTRADPAQTPIGAHRCAIGPAPSGRWPSAPIQMPRASRPLARAPRPNAILKHRVVDLLSAFLLSRFEVAEPGMRMTRPSAA